MKTITDELKKAIQKSGLTVYRISRESGVAQEQIHRFMSGERDLYLGTAAKVAAALDLVLVSKSNGRKRGR